MSSTRISTAMILAAGMGSRLRPLTDDTPKPLINVGGTPVVFRTMKLLANAGIERVVINTHYLSSILESAVRANTPSGMVVHFSHEAALLETGGGVRKALPLLGDRPFVIVNSDAVWREDETPLLRPLIEAFDVKKHDALLAVVPVKSVEEFQPLGDFKLDKRSGKLGRKGPRSGWDVVYAGVHVTHPDFIAREPEMAFSLNVPWAAAMEQGRLHGWLYKGRWAEMGTHSGLQAARALVSGSGG